MVLQYLKCPFKGLECTETLIVLLLRKQAENAGFFFVFSQLLSLCEADDTQLSKLPCYKAVQSLTPLRKSALSKFID